jgi:hypothetical protein
MLRHGSPVDFAFAPQIGRRWRVALNAVNWRLPLI